MRGLSLLADSRQNNLRRLKRELKGLDRSISSMPDLNSEEDVLLNWQDFLRSFKIVSALIIRIAKTESDFRGLGWKMENELKGDPILKYLIVSRNHAEHPEDENKSELDVGRYLPDRVQTPIGAIGKNTSFSMSGCVVNGKPVDGGLYWGKEMEEPILSGNIPMRKLSKSFHLLSVQDAKGKKIEPPLDLDSEDSEIAIQFSIHAKSWIQANTRKLNLDVSL